MKSICNKNCKFSGDKTSGKGNFQYRPCTWCKHEEWNKKHLPSKMLYDHYKPHCEYCGKEFFANKINQVCCNQKYSTAKYQRDNPDRIREIKREWARKNRKSYMELEK